MIKQIFLNLPVKDLDKSVAFFTQLGFTFNPEFTDKKATCMIIGENIYAMLLMNEYFESFTKRGISDTAKTTEAIIAISAANRDEVDKMAEKVTAAGGKVVNPPSDYGWMYSRSFFDLDGHMWEVFYMDEAKRTEAMKK